MWVNWPTWQYAWFPSPLCASSKTKHTTSEAKHVPRPKSFCKTCGVKKNTLLCFHSNSRLWGGIAPEIKSMFTWEVKWTQTGMRCHFSWKCHFGVQSAFFVFMPIWNLKPVWLISPLMWTYSKYYGVYKLLRKIILSILEKFSDNWS